MALQYETTKEHTITVTGYEGTIRHLVIPDQATHRTSFVT